MPLTKSASEKRLNLPSLEDISIMDHSSVCKEYERLMQAFKGMMKNKEDTEKALQ